MNTPHPDLIAWIGVETTGLDHEDDRLLEVAVVITNNALGTIFETSSTLRHPASALERMNDYVRDMHARSGLLAEIAQPLPDGKSSEDRRITTDAVLTEMVLEAIHRAGASLHGRSLILGGNSITLDRMFLQRHMPRLFSLLHYRSIDVASIEEEMRRDGYDEEIEGFYQQRGDAESNHRALDDAHRSIATLDALRQIRATGCLRF